MIITAGRRGFETFLSICIAILFGLSVGHATLLNPGASINLRFAAEPDDAHLIAQTNFAFASGFFSGTLASKVWECDESNPWGGLTFTYKISSAAECANSLGLFALLGFEDSLIDVNYSGEGIAPRTATRSEGGNKITFSFFDRRGTETLLPGATSTWLVIQTSAATWGLNQLIGLDAEDVRATTFAPVAVPEPSLVVLSCLAIGIVSGCRRRV